MNKKTLTRELVRAKVANDAAMKKNLEQMNVNLEKMLAAQLKTQTFIDEREGQSYELAAGFDDDEISTAREKGISFRVLLEMVVNNLKA